MINNNSLRASYGKYQLSFAESNFQVCEWMWLVAAKGLLKELSSIAKEEKTITPYQKKVGKTLMTGL